MKADAPRPLRIPRWVPEQVAAKARELSRTGIARPGGPLLVASEADFQRLLRLTTDKRMRWVWRELGKRRGDGYLHPAWPSRQPVADRQGLGMALLFLHALKLMRDEPLDQPSSANRKDAAVRKRRKDVAAVRAQCAGMAITLRAMAARFLEPPPDEFDREEAREEARKFEAVALVLDRLAVKPHVRDRGNSLIRYVTGDLVRTFRIIFGASHYRCAARIASVLLATNVSASTVHTWHPSK